ncbi:hypothetical protein CDL12_15371 [Handroanthus impetiginosus]|uniref:Uncharacterized protein n=1 Tax=Handroanthus impetiginosus TaxID=429701 RepID=A0A2G9H3D8_9LAMI|nr:hypothetical protein CDL12_15371 [Handroanthus impetiginosus]
MHLGLLYILQRTEPHTFKELATRAHDMKLSMANHGIGLPMERKKKDKKDSKKNEKNMKISTKDFMAKVNRILIDDGSAVNIMPKSSMKRLGIPIEDLSCSQLIIQSFNQDGQKVIGMIHLDLMIGELKVSTLFYVTDTRTSNHLHLRRPWLHENKVIPSTLHQCFKYAKDEIIMKVDADTKPFTDAESYFVNVKFYLDPNSIKEVLPLKIANNNLVEEGRVELSKLAIMEANRVIESPLRHNVSQSQSKALKADNYQKMKKGLVMPITNIHAPGPSKPFLEEVYEEFKGVFDSKSYKLLEKFGFNFASLSSLGKLQPELTGKKVHGLIEKQQELRNQLGYTPIKSARICITKKNKCVNVQYITAEDGAKDKEKQGDKRVSIFNQFCTRTTHFFIFEMLDTLGQMSTFKNKVATRRRSVFARLGTVEEQQQKKAS